MELRIIWLFNCLKFSYRIFYHNIKLVNLLHKIEWQANGKPFWHRIGKENFSRDFSDYSTFQDRRCSKLFNILWNLRMSNTARGEAPNRRWTRQGITSSSTNNQLLTTRVNVKKHQAKQTPKRSSPHNQK